MKIAVLSESPADEAAVSILIEGLLGVCMTRVPLPTPGTRGWKGTFNAVALALRHLHYRTDEEASSSRSIRTSLPCIAENTANLVHAIPSVGFVSFGRLSRTFRRVFGLARALLRSRSAWAWQCPQ